MSRFVIQVVRAGPPELRDHLPIYGHTLDIRPGPQRDDEFFYASLDQPLKYRYPADFDITRCGAERLDTDELGPFLWITSVALHAHFPGEAPHFGMRGFPVDLNYVVDESLADDTYLDIFKIDRVGIVEIDDATNVEDARVTESAPVDSGRVDSGPVDSAPDAEVLDDEWAAAELPTAITTPEPAVPAHPPTAEPVQPLAAPDEFDRDVADIASQLGRLAGNRGDRVVTPERVLAGQPPVHGRPTYCIGPDTLRYHREDQTAGWESRETADPDELLYWIADDIASALAWDWAHAAPARNVLSDGEVRRTLWMPYWHIIMHGLRRDWSARTRARIRTLASNDHR